MRGESFDDLAQRFRKQYSEAFSDEQKDWFPPDFGPSLSNASLSRRFGRFEMGRPGRHPLALFRAACLALRTTEEQIAGHDWYQKVGFDRSAARWPGLQDIDTLIRDLDQRDEIAIAHLDLLETAPEDAQVFQTFICANPFPLSRDIATSRTSEEKALSFERLVGVSRAIDIHFAAYSLELANANRKMVLRLLDLSGPAEKTSVYPNFLLIGNQVLLTFSSRFPQDQFQLSAHGIEIDSAVAAKHFKQYFAEMRKCCVAEPEKELSSIKNSLWKNDKKTYLLDLARAFTLELQDVFSGLESADIKLEFIAIVGSVVADWEEKNTVRSPRDLDLLVIFNRLTPGGIASATQALERVNRRLCPSAVAFQTDVKVGPRFNREGGSSFPIQLILHDKNTYSATPAFIQHDWSLTAKVLFSHTDQDCNSLLAPKQMFTQVDVLEAARGVNELLRCIGKGKSSGQSKPWRWLVEGDPGWQVGNGAVQRGNLDEEVTTTEDWFYLLRYAALWPITNLLRAQNANRSSDEPITSVVVNSSDALDGALSMLQVTLPKGDRLRIGKLLDATSHEVLTPAALHHFRGSCKKLLIGLAKAIAAPQKPT